MCERGGLWGAATREGQMSGDHPAVPFRMCDSLCADRQVVEVPGRGETAAKRDGPVRR